MEIDTHFGKEIKKPLPRYYSMANVKPTSRWLYGGKKEESSSSDESDEGKQYTYMSIPVAKKGTSQFIDEPLRKNATKKVVK